MAYKAQTVPVLDGDLSKPFWKDVGFTEEFVDISTSTRPLYETRAKIRWDEKFLYIAAEVVDDAVWANISNTCHCVNSTADQVIYHDNDFEIFVDADGSTHFYKELEMNAANATWELCLNRPYADGGYENSSRVFGEKGWDYDPIIGTAGTLRTAVAVRGRLNDPNVPASGWSLEAALPLDKLAENTTAVLPPLPGTFWRINFSRVEWAVRVVNGAYVKEPSCQSCPVPGEPNEDNWVWSPQVLVLVFLS